MTELHRRAPSAGTGCIFLLTDYGYADEFAGLLRAAVARVAPEAPVVDLTHGVTPFDVAGGARALARCVPFLGPGVVVGVVDPGVGTERRPVAIDTDSSLGPRFLVGPDNGLLMAAADRLGGAQRAAVLPPATTSTTFDGRDVFAPAAARLWRGQDLASVGRLCDVADLVRLPLPAASPTHGALVTEVQWVDRFGNVQLAAGPEHLAAAGLDQLGQLELHRTPVGQATASVGTPQLVRRVRAFAAAGDQVGLLVDASGQLALVADRRSAAALLDLDVGHPVTLRAPGSTRHDVGDGGGGA